MRHYTVFWGDWLELISSPDLFYAWVLWVPSSFLAFILLALNWFISSSLLSSWRASFNTAQVDPYECGFEPYGMTNHRFLIFFYIVGILYIIFDLELIYVVPWLLDFPRLSERVVRHFAAPTLFLLFLIGAFVYEWRYGVLDFVYGVDT